MGQPIDFEGSNLVMRAPEGAENVQDMHVYRTRHSCVSCWTVTPDELAEITTTGRIFLSVLAGGQQPPLYVGSESTCREVMLDFGPVWPMAPRTPSPSPHVVGTIDCPCTTFEQDEDCPVGFPSLLCSACDGKGIAPIEKVVAFAAEMMKVAEQVDELEDPFAAWESIDLIKSQHGQLRAALKPFAAAPYTGPNSFNRAALSDDDFRQARHVLASTEGSDNG